jgi:hypothetical protein
MESKKTCSIGPSTQQDHESEARIFSIVPKLESPALEFNTALASHPTSFCFNRPSQLSQFRWPNSIILTKPSS